jgi:ABC-type antimicrobial peptide transport system permease subunit
MLLENQVYYTGLYFDGREGIGQTLNAAEELHYDPQSYSIEGVHTMTKAVDVFIPIFSMIAIILCVGVVFILTNFSVRMIKDKMNEIGILKVLGTKNSDIAIIFGLQVLLIAILTCILTTAGYFVFIDMANDVLIGSLKQLAPSHVVLDLDFLIFQPVIALLNCVIVFILSGISLALPMFKIKAIKPVKIIKTKD